MRARVRGAVAGAIGGIAGTLAMNFAQRLWTLAAERQPPASAAGPHDARDWQERDEDQNSNELAAQAIAHALLRRRLTENELSIAAPMVHFSFGAFLGAIYGIRAETRGRAGSGLAFGSAVWLTADEIAMPVVGLSRSTLQRPLELHVQSLVSHLVYGVITDRARRVVRLLLLPPVHRLPDEVLNDW